ncbi:chemotaxis protein CheA [Chromobacterium subtsugae]|uniref:Chemotaxis protein CheA n=1 Tax=Chromobacterium subtsugae TaxID=251747 RepID=A0ABS7FCN9_9NEIS|nr:MULTISPECIES: chemotaxis protein CheA [Chromobacterium]KUM04666.1 chemotaxis protein CheA [Chromobacterium subtsugae]KZE85780.1 chemotaxis protein CheA [Chromobacterium sp. F49]MBW7566415.1 chemotaxis protein CheA [Chromobacterium subtsugae]MBW8287726.1 chemotaxis protein CheA [Chromobacterium subtsugae]OBU85555.1 chemotaxis protein CheA [Chromobacterium subtsugae]
MDLEQALQTFLEESRELLADMESTLLDIEAEHADAEQLNALFRAMHTIKGSAGLFGLEEIVNFTHQAENLLDQLRDGHLRLDDELVGLLLRCHDHVKLMIQALAAKQDLTALRDEGLLAALRDYLAHPQAPPAADSADIEPPPAPASSRWLLSLRFGPDALRNGLDPSSFIRYLASIGRIEQIEAICCALPDGDAFDPESNYLRLEALYHGEQDEKSLLDVFEFAREDSAIHLWPLALVQPSLPDACANAGAEETAAVRQAWTRFGVLEPIDAAADAQPEPPGHAPLPAAAETAADGEARSAKPAESRFIKVEAGKLDNLINLIGELVIAGAAANLIARRAQQTPLVEATLTIASLIEQIRAGTLSMRMVQIGEIFQRFPRVVRDVSRELGKDIHLHIVGAETELDKSMVEKLGDPLLHIVRNAIDHGIEATDLRQAHGKPAQGNLWLNAYHESGSVVIEVADDGGGLDRRRILAKARERGLLGPDDEPPDSAVFQQIFAAGFSTAEQVTNLSGRGVGMDVVRRSIQQLHGTIDIDSEPGRGTTFRIRLPLTLAIIDGFLVEVAASTFVLPLEAVVECIELPDGLPANGVHDWINLRGELLPLLHLSSFFELPAKAAPRRNVVVVHYDDRKAGLVVDALQGEFQTVIKPLGALFSTLKAISGSTILGSGEVALILDVPSLLRHACRKEAEHFPPPDGAAARSHAPLPGNAR